MREVLTLAVDSSIDTSKVYRIVNAKYPTLCMEVAKAAKTEGANVRLYTINNSEAQFWSIDKRWKNANGWTYYLTYNFGGKVATIDHRTKARQNYLASGLNCCIRNLNTKKYPYSGWQFTRTGRTTTFQGKTYNNYYIHIPTSANLTNGNNWVLDCYSSSSSAPTAGTNIDIAHLDSRNSLTDQEWILVPSPEIKPYGVYSVYSYRDPKLMWDINGLTKVNGASLKLHASNGGNNQKFIFEFQGLSASDNDVYKIKSVYSDKLITLADNTPAAGVDIYQWEDLNYNTLTNKQHWEIRYLGAYPNKINGLSNLPVVDIRQTINSSEFVIDSKNASQSTTSNIQLNTTTHDSSEWWILVPTTATLDTGEIPTELSAWNWHWDSVDYGQIDTEEDNFVEIEEPNLGTVQSLYFYGYNDETSGLTNLERYWRLNPRIMPSCVMPMSWSLLGANKIQGSLRFRYLDAVTNTWSAWSSWSAWKTVSLREFRQDSPLDYEYAPERPYTAFIMAPDTLKMLVVGDTPRENLSGDVVDRYVSLPVSGSNETYANWRYNGPQEYTIAKRYQWQYRLCAVVSNSSWDGCLQSPIVNSPAINVIFKPTWSIVNDPTSEEPYESWIPYFWYDGLHIPYETDYEYGANKFHLTNYTCVQTTDEEHTRSMNTAFTSVNNADTLEFVIPLQYIFWPDENEEVSFTYRTGSDFWNTYPGSESYTINSINHRPLKNMNAEPSSIISYNGATLKVRVPHVNKERLFVVYFNNGQPTIKEVTRKTTGSTYTDFIVEYEFDKDFEIWVMVYDELNYTWGYDCSTVISKSDSRLHSPCHAFNWDSGSFILECDKDDYLETKYSLSRNSDIYKLNNREFETVIFDSGFSSRMSSISGFVAKDLTENNFKDIKALVNQGHVRYRAPDGSIKNVAIVDASWNVKYYGDYDGAPIFGSEVTLNVVEETV